MKTYPDSGTVFSLEKALPLPGSLEFVDQPHVEVKELVYQPYYFFEYTFSGAVKEPHLQFEDKGFIVLDGLSRQVVNDQAIVSEVCSSPAADYVLDTRGKFSLRIVQPKVTNYRQATELAIDYVVKKNTQAYTQQYGARAYERTFVPRPSDVSLVKNGFVQVPVWYIDAFEPQPDSLKRHKVILAASGTLWSEYIYCPVCQRKTLPKAMTRCQDCQKPLCQGCIQTAGLIHKKQLCPECHHGKAPR